MDEDTNSLFPFYLEKKFGFFNRDFEVAIPPVYRSGNPHESDFGYFTEGFALVRRTDLPYVFIDKQGVEIPAQCWDPPRQFSEGLAAVLDPGGWGFIDTRGDMVIASQFPNVESFACGLARVTSYDHKYVGHINHQGEWVLLQEKFQYVGTFYEGLADAMVNDKWGFINAAGEWVVDPIFDGAGRFSEGLGSVRVGKLWGYIDVAGRVVIEPQFKFLIGFHEGLSVFHDVKTLGAKGLINRKGEIVAEPKFENVGWFSEGMACASDLPVNDGDWPLSGLIDVTGKYVVRPQFSYIWELYCGLARVRLPSDIDQNTYYIDKTGKIVWSSLY